MTARRSAYADAVAGAGRAAGRRDRAAAVPRRRTSSASSRPAPTRGPGTGWSRCPGRTGVADALDYLEAHPRAGRPTAPGWSGASPTPTTTAASGSIGLEGLGSYAPRGGDRLLGPSGRPRSRADHRGGPAGHRVRPVGRPGQLDRHPLRRRRTGPPATWPRAPAIGRSACCRRRSRSATARCPTWCSTPSRSSSLCRNRANQPSRCANLPVTLRVSVIGTNYLGATHAAGMAEFGHHVIGVDIDVDRVKTLNAGQSHIFEVGLEPLLAKHTSLRPAAVHHRLRRDRRLGRRALPGPGHPVGTGRRRRPVASWTRRSTPWPRC